MERRQRAEKMRRKVNEDAVFRGKKKRKKKTEQEKRLQLWENGKSWVV